MREWDTEEETLASRGNGQHEPYLVVSKDEVDARVARLEAVIRRLQNLRTSGCVRTSAGWSGWCSKKHRFAMFLVCGTFGTTRGIPRFGAWVWMLARSHRRGYGGQQ
jgi:hypothetical protein